MAADAPEGWDAFISYSRQNKDFVVRLAAALNTYRPPKSLTSEQRTLRVFLDQHDLGTGDYAQQIEAELVRSRMLIVVCTPAARASAYVDDEVARFVRLRGADAVVPLLLAGLANNEASQAQAAEQAFPPALAAAMQMPLAVDYRGFDPRRDRVQRGGYEGPWHQLLAKLYGVERAEIEQRERRRQLVRWRWIGAGGAALIAVLSAALVVTLLARDEAERQRDLAEQRRRDAQARGLNLRAEASLAGGGPGLQRALLLSIESLGLAWTAEAQALLLGHIDRIVPPPLVGADDQRGPILAMAAAPAQGWLATQGVDRLMLRSSSDLKPLRDLGEPRAPGALRRLALSPDGRWLLAGCAEQVACVWDTADWGIAWHAPHSAAIIAAAFSPDSRVLALAHDGPAQVQLVDTLAWQAAAPLAIDERNSEPIQGLDFAGSAQWLLVRTRSDLELHDLRKRRKLQEIDTRGGNALALAPGTNTVLVDGATMRLRAVRITRDVEGAPTLEQPGEPLGVALDTRAQASTGDDGRRTAARTQDRMVQLLGPGGEGAPAFAVGGSAIAMVGAQRLAVGQQGGRIELFDLTAAAARRIEGIGADARLALSPDGQQLAIARPDGTARLLGTQDGRKPVALPSVEGARPRFSADGRWLLLAGTRTLVLLAKAGWREHWRSSGDDPLDHAWLTPDGRWLLLARGKRIERVVLPEARTAAPIALTEWLDELRAEPGGKRLAGHSPANVARGFGLRQPSMRRVWNAEDGSVLGWRSFERQDLAQFAGVGWGHRAKDAEGEWTLAEGAGDLALVDAAADWPLLPDLLASPEPPGVRWLADKDAAGTTLADHALRRAARLQGRPVAESAWSADGAWLATLTDDGTAQLWPLRPDALSAQACARLRRNLTGDEWRVAFGDEPYRPICAAWPTGN